MEDWAYQIEDSVDKLFSVAIADEVWTYVGRRAESGEITDGDWASMEDSLADYLDSWEGSLEGLETCLESAYGGGPTLVYDDILPDPTRPWVRTPCAGEDLERRSRPAWPRWTPCARTSRRRQPWRIDPAAWTQPRRTPWPPWRP